MQINDVLDRIRDRLDEPVPAHWKQTQLRRWLNDALNDASRMTRHIKSFVEVPAIVGTSEYVLPSTTIEIEGAWWRHSNDLIPLEPVHYDNVDNIWGRYQNITQGTPCVFTTYGASPFLTVKVYPAPTIIGDAIRMYVSREALNIDVNGLDDLTTIEFPNVWVDMICDYVEYCALRNDRQPTWQEAYNLYLSKRDEMQQQTYLDVERQMVFDPMVGGLPAWLVNGY